MRQDRKKVLFVISQLFKGGAEVSLIALLKLLPRDLYDLYLVVYAHDPRCKGANLLAEIPAHVCTCIDTVEGGTASRRIVDFVRSKEYDLAISYGEWHSPRLVMEHACAKRRIVWLHSDISRKDNPYGRGLFDWDDRTDAWICVSEEQRRITQTAFPFCADRCLTVHNPVDEESVRRLAQENAELPSICQGRKVILIVGNLRPAKNHVRAVRAAAILKKQGVDAVWVCIGSLADGGNVATVRREIRACGLAGTFLLLGSSENPWAYMAKADIVVSSSDFESWGMVFGEARILGVPCLATRTTGACEQIIHGETGLLCGFSPEALANELTRYFADSSLQSGIRRNLRQSPKGFDVLSEFKAMVNCAPRSPRPKAEVLYVIDDVNYVGGAHMATARMLAALKERGIGVDVYSGVPPEPPARSAFASAWIRSPSDGLVSGLSEMGFRSCVLSRDFTFQQKLWKLRLSLSRRLHLSPPPAGQNIDELRRIAHEYKVICVLSEGSIYRDAVARIPNVRKIQFIHTFYEMWRRFSEWTRATTERDGQLYEKMDAVCLIGERNAEAFRRIYPHLADKVFPFHNLIPVREKLSAPNNPVFHIVTVARIEEEKDVPRMVRIARQLDSRGLRFEWDVVGGGSQLDVARKLAQESRAPIHFVGFDPNPWLWLAKADLMVLLSHYEGLPNVVFEAMQSGIPVLSTAVGCVPDQIHDGVDGCLVQNDEAAIVDRLSDLLQRPDGVARWRNNLQNYAYDNEAAVDEFVGLLKI